MDKTTVAERAQAYFEKSGACAYSMVKALKEDYPQLAEINELMLEGFGGGFAGSGRICGVYSAATAVLSHLYMKEMTSENRVALYTMLNECYSKIELGYVGRSCKEICGCNFFVKADVDRYYDTVFETVCSKIVHDATDVIKKYI